MTKPNHGSNAKPPAAGMSSLGHELADLTSEPCNRRHEEGMTLGGGVMFVLVGGCSRHGPV
ncbi:MAG: hypothetical protein AVDCRST_MAG49-72 [uncultured Thermomicrobiales bacterium]|uniref:Uncharacterized protein n=1 Tax=uncultured Thermomicrobiales bacterium TaxID=1645740 RepID=A0A6J4TY86_9BACT|nr:MAG: hypothetical protein AVDCRST_MAG49-72 [uncultured Thermomicrobiales bacterium]